MSEQSEQQAISEVHFTYKADPDMLSLCQGDILQRTDDLVSVLSTVHPYFCDEKYKYFIVLSQSCDLVCRGKNNCKTPYITVAAVKEYSDFLEHTLVAKHFAELYKGFLFLDEKTSSLATQFVERLYNNTEPDYFFLYKEDRLNFPQSMVACLKLSIALKSKLHYQTLLDAKLLELSEEFKAKLGWLVGNMYSRVGTTDWENQISHDDKMRMIENDLYSHCVIGTKEKLKRLKKELNKNPIEAHDDVQAFLSSIIIPSKYDQLIQTIEETINQMPRTVTESDRQLLLRTLKSKAAIKQIMGVI